jgi:hypothetical protein
MEANFYTNQADKSLPHFNDESAIETFSNLSNSNILDTSKQNGFGSTVPGSSGKNLDMLNSFLIDGTSY